MNLRRFSTCHAEAWRNAVAAELNTVLREIEAIEARTRAKGDRDRKREFCAAALALCERVADFEEIESNL